jgi:hypothetical protein
MKKLICILALLAPAAAFSQSDPLKDFQPILSRCQAEADALPRDMVVEANPGRWGRSVHQQPKVSYDVKRTDSLARPATAVIRVERWYSVGWAASEAEARTSPVQPTVTHSIREFRYGYDSGKWKTIGGSSQMRSGQGDDFREVTGVMESTMESLLKLKQLGGCVER